MLRDTFGCATGFCLRFYFIIYGLGWEPLGVFEHVQKNASVRYVYTAFNMETLLCIDYAQASGMLVVNCMLR